MQPASGFTDWGACVLLLAFHVGKEELLFNICRLLEDAEVRVPISGMAAHDLVTCSLAVFRTQPQDNVSMDTAAALHLLYFCGVFVGFRGLGFIVFGLGWV